MKTVAMLILLAAAGCGRAPDPAAGRRTAAPTHVSYALDGLISGRRTFYNRARCLAMRKVYADAMEVGLGPGGGAQLKCVPVAHG